VLCYHPIYTCIKIIKWSVSVQCFGPWIIIKKKLLPKYKRAIIVDYMVVGFTSTVASMDFVFLCYPPVTWVLQKKHYLKLLPFASRPQWTHCLNWNKCHRHYFKYLCGKLCLLDNRGLYGSWIHIDSCFYGLCIPLLSSYEIKVIGQKRIWPINIVCHKGT
jgi:hypothetical protein